MKHSHTIIPSLRQRTLSIANVKVVHLKTPLLENENCVNVD